MSGRSTFFFADFNLQSEIACVSCGEDQRCPVSGKDEPAFAGAENFLLVDGMERWGLCGFDRRQRDDEYRLGIVKGRRRVELEVQAVIMLGSQRRDVLIFGGVNGIQDARDVDDRRNVRAVIAEARTGCVAGLHAQVAGRSGCESADDGHAVPVVQNQRILLLHQAGGLLFNDFVQTIFIELHAQTAGEQRRNLLELFRIGRVNSMDGVEVSIETRTVKTCLIQVLRGANK